MKTFLVHLEKFDNVTSTREKIRWAKGNRILIIWPKRGKIALSSSDIELIKREAFAAGSDVAFVCQDPEILDYSAEFGVSVFQSVPQAESSRWQINKKDFKAILPSEKKIQKFETKKTQETRVSVGKNISRVGIFVLVGAAILAMIIFFIPSAKITIYPELTPKDITVDIWASPEIDAININGSLPAKIQVIQLSKSATAQSSGLTKLPSKNASGQVIFHNISGKDVVIPKGTILISADAAASKFSTLEEITVAIGSQSDPVGVQAIQAGTSANVQGGSITIIDGYLGSVFEVTNPEPTSGGEDIEAPSPTEEDFKKIKDEILAQLRLEAIDQQQQEGIQLIPATLDQGKIVSEIRSVDPGMAADTFSLTLNAEYRALSYSNSDLTSLVQKAMNASLERGDMIYGNGVLITSQTPPNGDLNKGAYWTVKASALTGKKIDQNAIVQAVIGKTIPEAQELIQNRVAVREPSRIETFPRGWQWLPWLSLNLHVEVQ
jgi:hypothetical protein